MSADWPGTSRLMTGRASGTRPAPRHDRFHAWIRTTLR